MYIKCASCSTSFVITSKQIGVKGRNVRCSKCNHAWRVGPVVPGGQIAEQASSIVPSRIEHGDTTSSFKPGVNLPALLPINIPIYLYIIPILLTAAIIFTSAIIFQDKLSFLGLEGTSENLGVHDINIDYDRSSGKIIASYKIVNSSPGFIPVPLIRIRLLDANHRTLKTHVVQNAKVDLAPKQYITIRTNFADSPPNVEFMDITLGNRLDFILR